MFHPAYGPSFRKSDPKSYFQLIFLEKQFNVSHPGQKKGALEHVLVCFNYITHYTFKTKSIKSKCFSKSHLFENTSVSCKCYNRTFGNFGLHFKSQHGIEPTKHITIQKCITLDEDRAISNRKHLLVHFGQKGLKAYTTLVLPFETSDTIIYSKQIILEEQCIFKKKLQYSWVLTLISNSQQSF